MDFFLSIWELWISFWAYGFLLEKLNNNWLNQIHVFYIVISAFIMYTLWHLMSAWKTKSAIQPNMPSFDTVGSESTNNLILENRKVSFSDRDNVTWWWGWWDDINTKDWRFLMSENYYQLSAPSSVRQDTLCSCHPTTTTTITNYYFQLFCFKFWLV